MKALIRSPLMRQLGRPPRVLAPHRIGGRASGRDEPSVIGEPHGRPYERPPEPKWKRVLVRLGHQGIRAGEASVVASVLGYVYGRSGPETPLTKAPLDLLFGLVLEGASALTESDVASSHLEAAALGAIALHAGAWGRARGQDDRLAAEVKAKAEDAAKEAAKALPGKTSASGYLGDVGERSPERGTASMSEEELARLITRT